MKGGSTGNPIAQKQSREIMVGLHSSAMALSPNGRWIVVANAGSDTLSVIDTATDQVVETIWTRQNPGDLFGANPNALAFDESGRNARQFVMAPKTRVGVAKLHPGESKLAGLIPVGSVSGCCDPTTSDEACSTWRTSKESPRKSKKIKQAEVWVLLSPIPRFALPVTSAFGKRTRNTHTCRVA